jgi:hypothetical protein
MQPTDLSYLINTNENLTGFQKGSSLDLLTRYVDYMTSNQADVVYVFKDDVKMIAGKPTREP